MKFNRSGRYDRGTCFSCKGLKVIKTAKKPKPYFKAIAADNEGVKRILVMSAATEKSAIERANKKIAMCPAVWNADTLAIERIDPTK